MLVMNVKTHSNLAAAVESIWKINIAVCTANTVSITAEKNQSGASSMLSLMRSLYFKVQKLSDKRTFKFEEDLNLMLAMQATWSSFSTLLQPY
ncbi:hypothetical protein PS15m_008750 [Mucor circinelloides]